MKVSRAWLQRFFDVQLPSVAEIEDALTFHAFEIEGVEGETLDVKVLPDRAAYALSHRGIAKEVSAIFSLPLARDPLMETLPAWERAQELMLSRGNTGKVNRMMGALVRGVKVAPSPAWLKELLESVGARSINNVVDVTNFVTLNMGQPLHAFDAGKIARSEGKLHITVRAASAGESITTLSGETYALPEGALVIAEGSKGTALDIAGIKGGAASAITEDTIELFVSVANFDAGAVRKTAQALNLFTDASQRFQNKISPELAAYGMRDVLALIQEVAGGEVVGVNDEYEGSPSSGTVAVTLSKINKVLGSSYAPEEVEGALTRLGLTYSADGETYTVAAPFERRDLAIAEDLVEEVGRTLGYQNIQSQELPAFQNTQNPEYLGMERIKDWLRERGYTEVSTQSFAKEGDILLANPLDKTRPALRASLRENMADALMRAQQVAPRVLGPIPLVRLFELGSVFPKEGEQLAFALGVSGKSGSAALDETLEALSAELGTGVSAMREGDVAETIIASEDLVRLGDGYAPASIVLGPYRSFSVYPFALRDIAVWTPGGTEESEVVNAIIAEAGEHLARIDQFDRFEKDGKISYAFRIVFESKERTLTDADLNPVMERVTEGLNAREGWSVR